jgi:hypothetical protein
MTEEKFTKKQHYIPQFYLKNFSLDGEHIYVYDKEVGVKGSIRYQTTIDIAHQNHFYTHRVKEGGRANLEDLFSMIEGNAATAIRNVYANRKVTDREIGDIATFVAFQYTRTPAYKASTENHVQVIGEAVSRKMLEATPKEWMKKFLAEKGKNLTDAEIEDIKDFGTNKKRSRIEFDVPTEYWIKTVLDTSMIFANLFATMDWNFIIADKQYAFITTDNPFLLLPPKYVSPYRGVGLATSGSIKIIPLLSNMVLEIGDESEKPTITFSTVNKNYYRPLNRSLMAQSERFTFAPEKGKLEKMVKDIKPYNIKSKKDILLVD